MPKLAPLCALRAVSGPEPALRVGSLRAVRLRRLPEESAYSSGDPELHEPYTYLYGCDGKDYCTAHEVNGTNTDDEGLADTVSTTRNGIRMELGRYRGDLFINFDGHGVVDTGNGSYDFTLFLLDFDTPLRSFAGDISRPELIDRDCVDDGHGNDVCTDIYSLVKVYL